MSEVDSSLIKRGFWIDYKSGSALGATITIDQEFANVIIALLAIVVSVSATSAWNLLLFAVYQLRATSSPKDGLYRQQQLLLRTLLPPGSTLVELLKLFRVWTVQHQPINVALRCLIPAAVVFVFALGSVVTGIFSAYIVTTGFVEVLVSSPLCKDLNLTTWFNTSTNEFDTKILTAATTFADECYSAGPLPSRCRFFVHPRIEWSTKTDHCPFQSSICVNTSGALTHDSGYLDSNEIFGLNAPAKDRVQFRRKMTCAPLKVAEHISIWNGSDSAFQTNFQRKRLPDEEVWSFDYSTGTGVDPDEDGANSTTMHSMVVENVTFDFTVESNVAYISPDMMIQSSFDPMKELQKSDADVFMIFVAGNSIMSEQPIEDPVYSAHQPAVQHHQSGNRARFRWDLPLGVIGCALQYQFCIQDRCSPLNGFTLANFEELLPSVNPRQARTLALIRFATGMAITNTGVDLSPPFLDIISRFSIAGVTGVPDNQWMLDLGKMESLLWAQIQVIMATHATGFPDLDDELLTDPSSTKLCQNQKVIKAGGFANIRVLGLGLTLGVSALLVLLDYGIIRLFLFTMDFKKAISPGLSLWFEEGIFRLQRTAYEAHKVGLWGLTDNEIPVTAPGELLRNIASYHPLTSSTAVGIHGDSSTHSTNVDVKHAPVIALSVADNLPVLEKGPAKSISPQSSVIPIPSPWPTQSGA